MKIKIENSILHCLPDAEIQVDTRGLGALLFDKIKQNSDKIAQIDATSGQTHTYKDLLLRSISVARYIESKNVTKEDVIAVFSYNILDACIPVLAALYLQIPISPLDATMGYNESISFLTTIRPRLLFCEEQKVDQIEKAIKEVNLHCDIVVFGKSEKYTNYFDQINNTDRWDEFKVEEVQDVFTTAVIMFTSGTTSLPKGICCTHYGLMVVQMAYKRGHCFNMSLQFSSLYWISGIISLIVNILDGTTRLLCNRFDVDLTLQLIQKYQVTFTWISPYIVKSLVKSSKIHMYDTSSVLSISVAGDMVPDDIILQLREGFPNAAICNTYGTTENSGVIVNFNPIKDRLLIDSKINYAGLPIPGSRYKIVDLITNELVGPNVTGEIRVKNKNRMKEYKNNPDDTQKAYDEDGFFCTGDLGYYDDDFCFYVERRINDVIIYRQWHIIPSELDAILLQHPVVQEAAVIGIPNSTDREHPMGVVVLKPNATITEEDILQYYNNKVEEHKRLRAGIKFVDQLPYTVSGKLRRNVLRENILKDLSV